MINDERCKKQIWHQFRHIQCGRKATRDGWCFQHHPDAVRARREKVDHEVEATLAWSRQQRDLRVERERKGDAFDALLAACVESLQCGDPKILWDAVEAAKKAVAP